jgi:hypothetical protein
MGTEAAVARERLTERELQILDCLERKRHTRHGDCLSR